MSPRARRGGELETLKGRIAEAFVEAIFRRAGYRLSSPAGEKQMPQLVGIGAGEFLPNFLLHRPPAATPSDRPPRRWVPVAVKYRASIEEFLQSQGGLLLRVGEQWRELCIVVVTDHPASGRSCFQVVDFATTRSGQALAAVDLHHVHEL